MYLMFKSKEADNMRYIFHINSKEYYMRIYNSEGESVSENKLDVFPPEIMHDLVTKLLEFITKVQVKND